MKYLAPIALIIFCLNAVAQETDANCFWRPSGNSRLSPIMRKARDFDACQMNMRAEILRVASSDLYNGTPGEMNGTLVYQNETAAPQGCETVQLKATLNKFEDTQLTAVQVNVGIPTLQAPSAELENALPKAIDALNDSVACNPTAQL